MTKKELNDRERYPYLDPIPTYCWWDLAGGVILIIGMAALAYVLLWVQ